MNGIGELLGREIMKKGPSIDLSKTEEVMERSGRGRDSCIRILQGIQSEYGYLPEQALQLVVERSEISKRRLYGVATFYDQFRFRPVGKHMIRVCHGTACHVNGANAITSAVEAALNIENGETTEDGLFTLESVACLGCCSLAPVMMIDDTVYGRLTPSETRKVLKRYAHGED